METITRTLRKYSLRQWFYGLVAAFILWPVLMYIVLKLMYGTSIAPDYQASFVQHLPVLFFMAVTILIEAALVVVSAMLMRRTVKLGYKVVFAVVTLLALFFLYYGVASTLNYIDIIS